MKRTAAFLLIFALIVCIAAGCAKKKTDGSAAAQTVPFAGEEITDDEGSTYRIAETVTDKAGNAFNIEPVTDRGGALIGAQTVPVSTEASPPATTGPGGTTRPEGTTAAGQTRNPAITQVTARQTSPNHLTQRPTTAAPTSAPTAKPATTRRQTTAPAPSTFAPTSIPYKEPTVDYGGTLSYTANGATDSVRIVSHKCELTVQNTIMVTFTAEPVSFSGKNSLIKIGYNCFDKDGNKLNTKLLETYVAMGIDGDRTSGIATAPMSATRIEFTNCA